MRALLLSAAALVLLVAGAACAESLVDIKVEELGRPVKPRWGRDPFLRFEDREGREEEALGPVGLEVEGIISDGRRALAIINNAFYRKGDMVDGFVIQDILSDRVMLVRDGHSYALSVEGFATRPGKEAGQ